MFVTPDQSDSQWNFFIDRQMTQDILLAPLGMIYHGVQLKIINLFWIKREERNLPENTVGSKNSRAKRWIKMCWPK